MQCLFCIILGHVPYNHELILISFKSFSCPFYYCSVWHDTWLISMYVGRGIKKKLKTNKPATIELVHYLTSFQNEATSLRYALRCSEMIACILWPHSRLAAHPSENGMYIRLVIFPWLTVPLCCKCHHVHIVRHPFRMWLYLLDTYWGFDRHNSVRLEGSTTLTGPLWTQCCWQIILINIITHSSRAARGQSPVSDGEMGKSHRSKPCH